MSKLKLITLLSTALLFIGSVRSQSYDELIADMLVADPGTERSMKLAQLADIERNQGRNKRAAEFASLAVFEAEQKASNALPQALLSLSRAQQAKGDLDGAALSGIRASSITENDHSGVRTAILLHLASLNLEIENPERALEYLGAMEDLHVQKPEERMERIHIEAEAKRRTLASQDLVNYLNTVAGEVMTSKDPVLQIELLAAMATAHAELGATVRAIELEERILGISMANGLSMQAGISANNLAELLQKTPRAAEAPELYQRAIILLDDKPLLRIRTMINSSVSAALAGDLSFAHTQLAEAANYASKSNWTSILAQVQRTQAVVFLHQGEPGQALERAEEGLRTAKTAGDRSEQGLICELIARVFERQGDAATARAYDKAAREHRDAAKKESENQLREKESERARIQRQEREQLEHLNRQQVIESERKEFALNAENQQKRLALLLAEKQLEESGRREALLASEQAEQKLELTQAALQAERNERMIKDLENTRLLQSMSMDRLDMERKQRQREVELLEQKNEVTEARSRTLMLERASERATKRYSIIGAIAMLGIALYMAWAWYVQRKKKRTILVQKKRIELINNELADKNKDIESSLTYARTIQSAILPSEEYLKALIPESFMVYKPLHKVSGDLPFVKQVGDRIYVAAIDCTGHGVPAAMMTFIAYYGLNGLLESAPEASCGTLLDRLHEHVGRSMEGRAEEGLINDGMDVGLCCIDLRNGTVAFAGAQLPLIHVRGGESNRIKGDVLPLGDRQFERNGGYKDHALKLLPGDSIYLYSDGITHQFGGVRGQQKFSQKRLIELLGKKHESSMHELKETLLTDLADWKGNEPQTDDVLMIGMRYAA